MDYDELLRKLAEQFSLHSRSVHGPRHWVRVRRYGLFLAPLTGADGTVVELFSLFHDCRRVSESYDPDHGRRGGELARQWCGMHFQLEAERLELLVAACDGHTDELSSPDPTIGTCWDADRLDLDRVGIDEMDLDQLSTAAARELGILSWSKRHQRVGLKTFGNS